MGPTSRETWAQRLGTFRASPSAFMAGPEGEDLGRHLLSDLRSEKLSEPTKATAWECLRELESCKPGLLGGCLGLLRGLLGQEGPVQPLSLLLALALRNALAPSWPAAEGGECCLATLELSPEEARELRAAVAQLLDASYLLTPVAQAQLLWLLGWALRDEEKEEKGQDQSPRRYLEELLAGLRQRAALGGGPRALATLCFQASYLVARCLAGQPAVLTPLTHGLAQLYRARPALAPHFVDLLDRVGPELGEPLKVVLRREVVSRPGRDEALCWHLQMLARVADGDAQSATLGFLQAAAARCTDWGLQQALLQVCRALLRAGVGGGLADLLQVLARQLEDPDGRDHARLYYILLAHLEEPKLGVALGPSLAAPALASSLVAENQGFAAALMVQEAPAPIRLSVGPHRAKGPAPVLQLQVEVLEQVYSLELRFRVERQLYAPLGAVHVPCLCPGRPIRPLLLPLQPRRPAPARLAVRALYTTPSGLTCHAHLPPLLVNFADLFLPFPQPPEGAKLGFFEELWDSCLPKGTESRLWCPLGSHGLEALVSRHLEPFVVVAQPPTSYLIAIRLPPDSRLLLRLEAAQADGVPVALRTDDWAVLPLVGDYLRGLSAAG
ncbi:hypothetical protein E2I00_007620 [Balaenoptera physalus]|uniref:Uncharacterized protein n=1 Tax=Balaenoptera physalus TaxID=9770 RepID=A0A6A1QK30_BALPH|nr:hypothetical protein E2I00_007620 [Balaenoptera physalus]